MESQPPSLAIAVGANTPKDDPPIAKNPAPASGLGKIGHKSKVGSGSVRPMPAYKLGGEPWMVQVSHVVPRLLPKHVSASTFF